MATSSWFSQSGETTSSAVIDLTDSMMGNDGIDAMVTDDVQQPDFSQSSKGPAGREEESGSQESQAAFMNAVKSQVAETVWQTGKQQARRVFDLYGNIDLLRPYFDVEPKTVIHRLVLSFLPLRPSGTPQKAVGELYGPLMIVFTLVAILLMGMKDSGHTVREGTLMGTAIGIGFGYWFLASGLYYGVSFICNTNITFLQVLSLTGYGMFAFCIVLFLGTTLHSTVSHTMFYTVWGILGGLSSLRMVGVYLSRTNGRSHKLTIAAVVAAIHVLFLLYLHFSYHKIVEDITSVYHPLAPIPKAQQHGMFDPPVKLDLPNKEIGAPDPAKVAHPMDGAPEKAISREKPRGRSKESAVSDDKFTERKSKIEAPGQGSNRI